MNPGQDGQAAAQTVQDVIELGILGPALPANATGASDPRKILGDLIANDSLFEAVALLAALLPVRIAVWWSCLCAWNSIRPQPSPSEDAALRAATAWVIWPTEENRRAAERIYAETPGDSSAFLCAKAVAYAGRILEKDGSFESRLPAVSAAAVSLGVRRAAEVRPTASSSPDAWRMLHLGLLIARGDLRWPTPKY